MTPELIPYGAAVILVGAVVCLRLLNPLPRFERSARRRIARGCPVRDRLGRDDADSARPFTPTETRQLYEAIVSMRLR